jgi:hypothetical protein
MWAGLIEAQFAKASLVSGEVRGGADQSMRHPARLTDLTTAGEFDPGDRRLVQPSTRLHDARRSWRSS